MTSPEEIALAHMPDILQGTATVRCGTCRHHSGKGEAGMGICRRYRGSLPMLVRSWEACWHHQLGGDRGIVSRRLVDAGLAVIARDGVRLSDLGLSVRAALARLAAEEGGARDGE